MSRMWQCGLDSSGSGYCPVAGCYEHDSAKFVFYKGRTVP